MRTREEILRTPLKIVEEYTEEYGRGAGSDVFQSDWDKYYFGGMLEVLLDIRELLINTNKK